MDAYHIPDTLWNLQQRGSTVNAYVCTLTLATSLEPSLAASTTDGGERQTYKNCISTSVITINNIQCRVSVKIKCKNEILCDNLFFQPFCYFLCKVERDYKHVHQVKVQKGVLVCCYGNRPTHHLLESGCDVLWVCTELQNGGTALLKMVAKIM